MLLSIDWCVSTGRKYCWSFSHRGNFMSFILPLDFCLLLVERDICVSLISKRISSRFIFFFRETAISLKNEHITALCELLESSVLLLFLKAASWGDDVSILLTKGLLWRLLTNFSQELILFLTWKHPVGWTFQYSFPEVSPWAIPSQLLGIQHHVLQWKLLQPSLHFFLVGWNGRHSKESPAGKSLIFFLPNFETKLSSVLLHLLLMCATKPVWPAVDKSFLSRRFSPKCIHKDLY